MVYFWMGDRMPHILTHAECAAAGGNGWQTSECSAVEPAGMIPLLSLAKYRED